MEETQQLPRQPLQKPSTTIPTKEIIVGTINVASRPAARAKDADRIDEQQLEEGKRELGVEDLESVPIAAGDIKESSMVLTESASELRTSVHQKYSTKAVSSQENHRSAEDWGSSSGGTYTTAASSYGNSLPGSDSHFPISPRAESSNDTMKHPHSAPQALQSVTPSSRGNGQEKRGLLRKKIKMSNLLNSVGKGLDLSSSSHPAMSRSDPAHTSSIHMAATVSRVGATEEQSVDHSRRQQNEDEDEDFASPQQCKGVTGKMASKMRKSIIGWTSMANIRGKSTVIAPLENGNDKSANDIDQRKGGDLAGEEPPILIKVPSLEHLAGDTLEDVAAAHDVTSKTARESTSQANEAKNRRRAKQKSRQFKRANGANRISVADAEDALPSKTRAKRTGRVRSKLDPDARQRLRKHSAANEFRNSSAATRLRRQQFSTSKQIGDADLIAKNSSHSHGDHDNVLPTPVKISRRKVNKEEDEKLRTRVRRQSLFAAQGREPSYSGVDIMDKEDAIENREEDRDSFAGEITESNELVNDDHRSPVTVVGSDAQEVPDMGGSSSSLLLDSSSTCLDANSVPVQGSFQRVESAKGADYFQLKIDGVPLQEGPEQLQAANSEYFIEPNGEIKKGTRQRGSKPKVATDSSIVSSAPVQGSFQRVESAKGADYFQLKIDGVPLREGTEQEKLPESAAMSGSSNEDTRTETRRRSSKAKLVVDDNIMDASDVRRNKGSRKHSASEQAEVSQRSTDRKAETSRTNSPRRHSDHSQSRRRRITPQEDGVSTSVLEFASIDVNSALVMPKCAGMLALKVSDTNYHVSPESNLNVEDNLTQAEGNAEGHPNESRKESRRQAGVERRAERKRASKVSAALVSGEKSAGLAKEYLPARGRSESTRKVPSSRGRSEARRESKKAQVSKTPRRHSVEGKRRIASTTIEDDTAKLHSDLGKSVTKIKW